MKPKGLRVEKAVEEIWVVIEMKSVAWSFSSCWMGGSEIYALLFLEIAMPLNKCKSVIAKTFVYAQISRTTSECDDLFKKTYEKMHNLLA